jgi:hypothetical protein
MIVIRAKNVQDALWRGMGLLGTSGVKRDSRNGTVLMAPEPVTTVYENPTERVLFWQPRDANPFFHLFESLWMLAGRNDTAFVCEFVKRMSDYSDDGETFHGAYGYRWVQHFGFDQLQPIVEALWKNKDDRRQVLQIWDATADLGKQGKDFPCNIAVHFQVNVNGALDMSVFNRSNDMIWGAYGANAVHFSVLQEYMAGAIGIPVGQYRQVSDNFHAYTAVWEPLAEAMMYQPHGEGSILNTNHYLNHTTQTTPLGVTPENHEEFIQDCIEFCQYVVTGIPSTYTPKSQFFSGVVMPMFIAHQNYKQTSGVEKYDSTLQLLDEVTGQDWALGASLWVMSRRDKFMKAQRLQRAQDDGVFYE